MTARSVGNSEQRLKVTMEILVAQHKVVPVSMCDNDLDLTPLEKTAAKLFSEGYQVQKICCGECDQDDILIVVHTCNPHKFTHTCKSKREEQELAEVKDKVKRKLFPSKEK